MKKGRDGSKAVKGPQKEPAPHGRQPKGRGRKAAAAAGVEAKPSEDIRRLLKLREEMRRRRPEFLRQESWRYKRLGPSWRRPKGIDSRMRRRVKGWPKVVSVGYRSPRAVRGLHPSGLRDALVTNLQDLEKLNPRTDAARFSSALGARKRAVLLARAKELRIKVLNPQRIRTPEAGE